MDGNLHPSPSRTSGGACFSSASSRHLSPRIRLVLLVLLVLLGLQNRLWFLSSRRNRVFLAGSSSVLHPSTFPEDTPPLSALLVSDESCDQPLSPPPPPPPPSSADHTPTERSRTQTQERSSSVGEEDGEQEAEGEESQQRLRRRRRENSHPEREEEVEEDWGGVLPG